MKISLIIARTKEIKFFNHEYHYFLVYYAQSYAASLLYDMCVCIIIMSLHPPQATNDEKKSIEMEPQEKQRKLASKMDPRNKSKGKRWIENSQYSSLVALWLLVSGDLGLNPIVIL